ncbi:MAG: hypothetical protein CL773_05545 [Chloroflexi bacterium]|nr:hypothetical protein [Chloroflexota bacterium]MBL07294.1 hypothetical protein [Chloroflexota bacterium]|tara:strand:+ start:2306 stop:2980 length:675 start_codon:yes stop_codon:yes gene_type:complete
MSINLSQYKGVVFDLDDTLIDRKSAYNQFIEIMHDNFEIFKHFSKIKAQEYFWNLSPNNSFNIQKALEKIKSDFNEFNMNYEEFYEFYYDNMSRLVKPFNGVAKFLDELKTKNIKLGIVTNGGMHQYKKLKNTGLENKHDFVIASEIFGYEKPHKKIFIETLRQLNLSPKEVENVVFIGDNPYTDIIGAQSVGFKTIWISMGREYPKDLRPPDYMISNFKELRV